MSALLSLSVLNNHWMPGHRLQLTALSLVLVVAGGLADLGQGAAVPRPMARRPGPLLLAALAVLMVISGWAYYPQTRMLADQSYVPDNHPARDLGLQIRRAADPGDWLVLRDAGLVPFFAGPAVKVLDMHERSLNDRHIAGQGWDLGYILSHAPRFVVLISFSKNRLIISHVVEGLLFGPLTFGGRYRHVQTVSWNRWRHYFVFLRDDRAARWW